MNTIQSKKVTVTNRTELRAEYSKLEETMDELINRVDSPFGIAKSVRERMEVIEKLLGKAEGSGS